MVATIKVAATLTWRSRIRASLAEFLKEFMQAPQHGLGL